MRITLTLITLAFSLAVFCQREATVEGEYTYRGSENVSVAEAKRIALERAKIQAIAEEFGTIVTSSTASVIVKENEKTSSKITSYGGSDVKGEWIGTQKEEFSQPVFADGMIIITARVKGLAREIISAPIDFEAQILNNSPTLKAEDDHFNAGDDIYLHFHPTKDGYLAVYLVDENEAFCLLPYQEDPDGQMPVKHGEEYIFFSEKKAPKDLKSITDEYVLTCSGQTADMNKLYIIYSPKPFTKAVDHHINVKEGSLELPRELDFDNFQKWLFECRKRDKNMAVDTREIIVSPKK